GWMPDNTRVMTRIYETSVASTDSISTWSTTPVLRSRTSTTPSASRLPMTTIVGMPSSSASLSFTPADTSVRSSYSTRTPASSSDATNVLAYANASSFLPATTTWTSAGAISRGQHSPRSSSVASAMAATARDTPMPYEPIVTTTCLPSGPSTVRSSASAYLRPSWKMWPISMPR